MHACMVQVHDEWIEFAIKEGAEYPRAIKSPRAGSGGSNPGVVQGSGSVTAGISEHANAL